MNKSQLVDALAERLGDRRTAAVAVDALLDIVVDTVGSGESVSLAGFGVFESRARAARIGRNPRTGETVDVPATTVPAFRPGTGFRAAVAGDASAAARSRPPAAAVTNGAGGDVAGAALRSAVELTAPEPTPPVPAERKKKQPKATKKADAVAPAAARDAGKAKGKKEKKGKKPKK